jgi:hypothetical protein
MYDNITVYNNDEKHVIYQKVLKFEHRFCYEAMRNTSTQTYLHRSRRPSTTYRYGSQDAVYPMSYLC